jgi:hypothetical protein
MKTRSILLAFALAWTVLSGPGAAQAADQPKVLILGEDADPDSIARDSRVFKRVLAAVSNQLNAFGFDVFDETAISLDAFAQGRIRRPDAEIIDVARSVTRPPIDVALLFTIYANVEKRTYTSSIRTRIEGRLLDVRSGRRLGNFEVKSPAGWNAPVYCPRTCLLEIVGDRAAVLAADLGAVLSGKLVQTFRGGGAFVVILSGFDGDNRRAVENYLAAFSGYRSHRLIRSSTRNAEFWYDSAIKPERLDRNLRLMLERLGLTGRIAFAGRTVTVENVMVGGSH